MRTRTWCVALGLLFIGVPAMSQTVLSEADALARLSTDGPRARAIRAAVEIARVDVLAASRWPNPQPTFTGNRWQASPNTSPPSPRRFRLPAANVRSAGRIGDGVGQLEPGRRRSASSSGRSALAFAELVSCADAGARVDRAVATGFGDLADVLTKREAEGDAAGFDRLRARARSARRGERTSWWRQPTAPAHKRRSRASSPTSPDASQIWRPAIRATRRDRAARSRRCSSRRSRLAAN